MFYTLVHLYAYSFCISNRSKIVERDPHIVTHFRFYNENQYPIPQRIINVVFQQNALNYHMHWTRYCVIVCFTCVRLLAVQSDFCSVTDDLHSLAVRDSKCTWALACSPVLAVWRTRVTLKRLRCDKGCDALLKTHTHQTPSYKRTCIYTET